MPPTFSATDFLARLTAAWPFLCGAWILGFTLGWRTEKLVYAAALLISIGFIVLGPHIAAASMALKLDRRWQGYGRWPLCLIVGLSTAGLFDYCTNSIQVSILQPSTLFLGLLTSVGAVLGHDAGLAALTLHPHPRRLLGLVLFLIFPFSLSIAVLAGYGTFLFTLYLKTGLSTFIFAHG